MNTRRRIGAPTDARRCWRARRQDLVGRSGGYESKSEKCKFQNLNLRLGTLPRLSATSHTESRCRTHRRTHTTRRIWNLTATRCVDARTSMPDAPLLPEAPPKPLGLGGASSCPPRGPTAGLGRSRPYRRAQEAHTRARQQTPPLAFPLPCQAVCRRARRAVHAKPSSLSFAAFLAFCSSRAFSYGESSSSAGAAAAAVLRLRLAVLSAPLS